MFYDSKNKILARNNRKSINATKQEGILWNTFLKNHSTNFTRQYRIENFILDFYAPSKKLAIELDGSEHFSQDNIVYDENRTKILNALGITVIRFTNLDVDKNLIAVQNKINEVLKTL